jgi:hypothetical protein
MNITVRIAGGRYYGQVRDGKRLMFHTPGYLTEAMAMADARCWVAFNAGEIMDIVQDADIFESRGKSDHRTVTIGAHQMRARIENARKYGVSVSMAGSTSTSTTADRPTAGTSTPRARQAGALGIEPGAPICPTLQGSGCEPARILFSVGGCARPSAVGSVPLVSAASPRKDQDHGR